MAKGKRKRSSKKKVGQAGKKTKKTKKKKDLTIGSTKKEKTIYDDFPAKTLNQNDANRLKEIFELSNNVAALIRDYAEKEIMIKSMRSSAKAIEKEKQPLIIQVAKNLYKTEHDYKKLAKGIRDQANVIEKQLILVKGQIAHRYEDYVSALVRQKRFLENVIKSAEMKSITGHRSDDKTKAEEEILFEKDFDKMTDDDIEELKKINKTMKKE